MFWESRLRIDEEGRYGDRRGMPVYGDYLAGLWGCGVAQASKKHRKMGLRIIFFESPRLPL